MPFQSSGGYAAAVAGAGDSFAVDTVRVLAHPGPPPRGWARQAALLVVGAVVAALVIAWAGWMTRGDTGRYFGEQRPGTLLSAGLLFASAELCRRIHRLPGAAANSLETGGRVNLRFIDWIWHIRGSVPLAPGQSSDEAFDRLDPLFRVRDTHHDRAHDALTFRKSNQAPQDKMSIFDAAFGPNLPIAYDWQNFVSHDRDTSDATIRSKDGLTVMIHTSFATILPGLHAAAFATRDMRAP